ncbi:MAG: ABC transporter permease [Acidobacteria bacterium]|nr:ABC transporter permease [Acidobacteriota bacterium]
MNSVDRLDSLAQDVRYAWRGMRRSPAVFTVTNAVLFKGFRSISGNDRILYIGTQNNGRGCCVSYPDFEDWREQATSFEGLGAVADVRITFSDTSGVAESYSATLVTANTFQLLGRTPIVGRDFAAADELPGAAPVAILTHGFWERRYGRNTAIVGHTVRINGVPTAVIGVMPQDFSFPQNQDLWMPLVPTANLQRREARRLWFAFGRMASDVTVTSARAELEAIGSRLASAYPRTNMGWVPRPLTFTEFFIGRNATMTYGAMWGAVGFVLLIACANLANLTMARAIGRPRELSLRIALGARRWRVVRQLLIESVLLSALGGVLGWFLAAWGVRAYALMANPPTSSWSDNLVDYSLDYRVFAYLVAISIGTGLLFGMAPALRLSTLDVSTALKDGGRGTSGGRGRSLSALLVIGEVALAVVLLAGAGVMIRSFANLYNADLGVTTHNTLTMLVNLPEAKYPGADDQISFYDRLTTRLGAVPTVESIAIASAIPTAGSLKRPYELAGAPPVDEQSRPMLSALIVGPAYFQTLGAKVLVGREFNDFDGTAGAPAVIVNQQFASTHWPGQDPLGQRLRVFDGQAPGAWLTVVGVVTNILQDDAGRSRQEFDPLVYLPYRQQPARNMWVLARTRVQSEGISAAFRHEVHALDPHLAIWLGPFTLTERLAGHGSYWNAGSAATLFLIFAAIALLLASVGLYAVMAHSVSHRTQEIGIRMAIGGTARDILGLVFKQGMIQLGVGLAIGLAASFAVNRVLKSTLVQVSPADPVALVVTSATLILCATLACVIPARRAMRVDPIVALRHE